MYLSKKRYVILKVSGLKNLQLKKYKLSYAAMPYSYRNHLYKKKQVKHLDLRIMFSHLKD